MQDAPVIIREDVTVSLDKDLIHVLLGIAEDREITLSVLVRDVLGSFCRAFRSGTDWTRPESAGIPEGVPAPQLQGSGDQISVLLSRLSSHDQMIAALEQRISLIESGSVSASGPATCLPATQVTLTSVSPQPSGQIGLVIDSDMPLQGSVSDDALVKVRRPIQPVMTSVDINSVGRINVQQMYSQTEAAALLNVSTTTLRKYIKDGRISSQKVGRSTVFVGKDLMAFLEGAR